MAKQATKQTQHLTPKIIQMTDEFIEYARCNDENHVRMRALRFLKSIYDRKNPETGTVYADSTNRTTVEAIRGYIRIKLGETKSAQVLKWFKYSKPRTENFNASQLEMLRERHRSQRPLDAENHIIEARELLASLGETWSNAAAISAVCALTGRRPWEVACVGTFEVDSDQPPHRLIFSGQTKTLTEEERDDKYPIDVLYGDVPITIKKLGGEQKLTTSELVIEVVDHLRSRVDPNMSNVKFRKNVAGEVGKISKKVFYDENGEPITTMDLRKAYARIASNLHPKYREWNHPLVGYRPQNVTEISYMKELMGHRTEDFATTRFYEMFYII